MNKCPELIIPEASIVGEVGGRAGVLNLGKTRNAVDVQALECARVVVEHVQSSGGHFCRTETGRHMILVSGQRIPLDYDVENAALVALLINTAGCGSFTTVGRLTIQRLISYAFGNSSPLSVRQFASYDGAVLWVPVKGGSVLRIDRHSFALAPNGRNSADLWLEHPCEDPFDVRPGMSVESAAVRLGLERFERMLVSTLSCDPAMAWFLAMHEALLPFVRDTLAARLIALHLGPSQSGKTTGAQRFLYLLGLGMVKGDSSIAAIGDMGDVGLVVLDNREQADQSRRLVNHLLFASTGAERSRSSPEGKVRRSERRPIFVLTSIEGLHADELRRRTVTVRFERPATPFDRSVLEEPIQRNRHSIGLALMYVLQRYIAVQHEPIDVDPVPGFGGHYRALVNLLRAYGDIAGRTRAWSEGIVSSWVNYLMDSHQEKEEDMLETGIVDLAAAGRLPGRRTPLCRNGKSGVLFTTTATRLYVALRNVDRQLVPQTASALPRRLRSACLQHVEVLDERSAPELPELRRTARSRQLGLFIEQAALDAESAAGAAHLPELPSSLRCIGKLRTDTHPHLIPDVESYFIWDYVPHQGSDPVLGEHAATELIRDLKIPVQLASGSSFTKKSAAIAFAARAVSAAIPEHLRRATFVPIPPSSRRGESSYDDRLERLLRAVEPPLDVRCMVSVHTSTPQLAKDLSVSVRQGNYVFEHNLTVPFPNAVVIFDDVLTTGSHFEAAKRVLRANLPDVPIFGLFLSRTIRGNGAAAAR